MTDEPTNEDRKPTEAEIKRFEEVKDRAQKHFYFLIGASITAWSSMEGYPCCETAFGYHGRESRCGPVYGQLPQLAFYHS